MENQPVEHQNKTTPNYIHSPRDTKIGLIFILLPIGLLIVTLFAFAISTFFISAGTSSQAPVAPGQFVPLSSQASLRLTVARLISVLLGFVGLISITGITFGLPTGIIMLIRKRLDPNSSYDTRSGQGKNSIVPAEIKKWSWAGFGITFIWGVYHSVWLSLLTYIPFVGFIARIYLGLRGNSLAWQKRRWVSVEQFHASQKKWAVWGIIFFVLYLLGLISNISILTSSFLSAKNTPKSNELYQEWRSQPLQ